MSELSQLAKLIFNFPWFYALYSFFFSLSLSGVNRTKRTLMKFCATNANYPKSLTGTHLITFFILLTLDAKWDLLKLREEKNVLDSIQHTFLLRKSEEQRATRATSPQSSACTVDVITLELEQHSNSSKPRSMCTMSSLSSSPSSHIYPIIVHLRQIFLSSWWIMEKFPRN